jgi:phenylpropionate dioxygenase-like ring-hydroxylating dioxygenase large terminal subunit
MTDIAQTVRDHYPGNTYQDIMRSDGTEPSAVLAEQRNPAQSTRDIAFSRYTSREFHDREVEMVWRKVWQYACREEHLPEVGDHYVYDIGRRSILIVRTNDGLRAFHNSCLHRGTKLKPSGDCGWSASIKCPFHGWEWNLDGSIRNIPCDWEFPQMTPDEAHLPEVRVESWNGCIFINMDRNAVSLRDYLEVVPQHFERWDLTGWYVHTHVQKRLPGNWKLSQEAFMEAYHTPVAHPEMTHVVSDHNMQHDILSRHVSRDLCAMASPSPTSTLEQTQQDLLDKMLMSDRTAAGERILVPEGKTARMVMADNLKKRMADEYGLDYSAFSVAEMIDSLKYNIFPNLFIHPSVGLPLILTFRPEGDDPDRSLFDVMVLRPKPTDGSHWDVAEPVRLEENQSYTEVDSMDAFFAHVLDQDTDIMRWQREGMYASEKGAETLSIYQESRIRHFHETLDSYLADGDAR